MDTLEELIYYCNETAPVGALMLTGEWGSGKTYLVEHDLRDRLKDTHILVRISLFGVDSIDALNTAVKKQWAENCGSFLGKLKDHDKAVDNGKKAVSTVASVIGAFVPAVKDITGAALAINPYDYITVVNHIGDDESSKKVVLIFDDLERTKLETVEVLGCINEYCENLGFNTIIIANEDKLSSEEHSGIQYEEIKEKIVARTVKYKPDFSKIINSIIDEKEWATKGYRNFLGENISLIDSIFETGSFKTKDKGNNSDNSKEKKQPLRNIRSLKCGLQDFYRIYRSLEAESIPHSEEYLYSFLAYTLAAKAGIATEGKYGFIFSDDEVKKRYPFFSSKKLLYVPRNWILHGEWDEELFAKEIQNIKEESREKLPKDILKIMRLDCLDEDVIRKGYPGLIKECYDGTLSLNEYVIFIENCCLARKFQIEVPAIDWDKVIAGINKRIDTNIQTQDDEGHSYNSIGDEDRGLFSSDEIKAYDVIKQYRRGDSYIFLSNRKQFLDDLENSDTGAFLTCKNKRFDVFDNEMASATARCFDRCSQSEKADFVYYFNGIWGSCDTSIYVDQKQTRDGFQHLIQLLSEIKEKNTSDDKSIAATHADRMIENLEKLIEKLDKTIDDKDQ